MEWWSCREGVGIDFEKTRALARTIMSEVTVKLVGLLEINIDKQRLDSMHIFSDMVSFGRKARRWHTLRPLPDASLWQPVQPF